MTTLKSLPDFLSHLKDYYGEGTQLKWAAMQEVETALKYLKMSRRQFLREAASLGYNFTTVESLGNWISCTYWPKPDNIDILYEALEAILQDRGVFEIPSEELRETPAIHAQELDRFRSILQDVDQAILGLEDAIAWVTLSEFPPSNISLPSSFISIRQHGIERLNIILDVHSEELIAKDFPQNILHSLIVSSASITLSHFLQEVGEHERAYYVADESIDILKEVLARRPKMRDETIIGGEQRTWAEHEVLGYLRRGTSLKNAARQTHESSKKAKFFDLASNSFKAALEKVDSLPTETRNRWKPGILRDIATLLIRKGGKDNSYGEAEQLARLASTEFKNMVFPDDPLLYYVCQMTLARALIPQGKLVEASVALEEARKAETYALKGKFVLPGPLHRSIFLQAEALYFLEKARSEGRNSSDRKRFEELWEQKIIENLRLARSSGLKDQEQQIRKAILEAGREFRQLIIEI